MTVGAAAVRADGDTMRLMRQGQHDDTRDARRWRDVQPESLRDNRRPDVEDRTLAIPGAGVGPTGSPRQEPPDSR